MIRGSASSGYTIVETMVFLAVTGVLFASAMATVGGRQASVEFTQGIRDTQSKLQEIINDVSTGYYPSNGDFTCKVVNPNQAISRPTFTATAAAQGSSDGCIFLGKSVQFTSDGAESGAGAVNYNVISITGRRVNTTGVEVRSLGEALPTALAPALAGDMAGISNKVANQAFQFGVKVVRITTPINGGSGLIAGSTYGSVVFLSTLPKFAGSSNNLASGKQRVSFAALPSATPLTDDVYAGAQAVNGITDATVLNPQNGIVICLSDQGGARRAMITVGEGSGQATAKLDTGNYSKAICEN